MDCEWSEFLDKEKSKEYYIKLMKFIDDEYLKKKIYPKKKDIFNVFNTDFKSIKVVILGQDPYHQLNQAHGLAFSVGDNVKLPPSLKNIFKELNDDVGCTICDGGNLEKWQKQGVFLLNTILTVEESKPLSHKGVGWEVLSDAVIKKLNDDNSPKAFILWGKNAQDKASLISNHNHLIVKGVHPSPLAAYRGFFGSKPFSRVNEFLKKNNLKEIEW
ncbi:MAG: uracil-DNA glycosylase [Anaerorhabdus sp.]